MFKPRQMIVVAKQLPKSPVCIRPSVGTKGMVVLSSNGSKCPPPEGMASVRFKMTDLGYVYNSENRFMVQYMPLDAIR